MPGQEQLIVEYQRAYLDILDDFFRSLTGRPASAFSTIEEADAQTKAYVAAHGHRIENPFELLSTALSALYASRGEEVARLAAGLPGLKAVLGGSSRFQEGQLDGVRRILLYVDTVLIPDPILPWLEVDRPEEQFSLVWLFRTAYFLLQLKPLIDADLPYPCVCIFPGWEKTADEDRRNREEVFQLTCDVVAHAIDVPLSSYQELGEYSRKEEERFLAAVEARNLFVAPGGPVGEPLLAAIERYRKDRRKYTQGDYLSLVERAGNGHVVVGALAERVTHQYHLIRHADKLAASPLLVVPAQEHYFRVCAETLNKRLEKLGFLNERTVSELGALNRKDLAWLGNVPIPDLVLLRRNDENEAFRSSVRKHLGSLHDATLQDTDRVAAEMARAIEKLLVSHRREVEDIQEKYSRKHVGTAVMSWASLAASLIPSLGPFVAPAAPLVLLTKYAVDKMDSVADSRKKARSLVGILASAVSGKKGSD